MKPDIHASNVTCDLAFIALMNEIDTQTEDEIAQTIIARYQSLDPKMREWYQWWFLRHGYWGEIIEEIGVYDSLRNRAKILKQRKSELEWIYGNLQDYRSRFLFYGCLANWYEFDNQILQDTKETLYKPYFDLDIISVSNDEVFVDLGAYTGDTVLDYLNAFCRGGWGYKKIYCYEITPDTFETLSGNLRGIPNIEVRQKGASDKTEKLFLREHFDKENISAYSMGETGSISVDAVALDDDINEPITFLKMDIEGGEQKALLGAAKHIRESKPKLAISVYHGYDALWEVPTMIEKICPGYKFWLRSQTISNMIPTEIVLLAVHESASPGAI